MQIQEMQKRCRATCREWAEGRPAEEIPDELRDSGVYQDTIQTAFNEINICDLSQGYTVTAMERQIGMLGSNAGQPALVPQFHPVGFSKVPIPRDIYAQILTNRKKLLNSKKKWRIEYCVPGMQNCNRVMESEDAQECHEVSRENYFYLPLNPNTLKDIFTKLRPLAEAWIDHKIQLIGTQVYGIRKYTRGARLAAHVDHLKSHVVSAILNVKQVIKRSTASPALFIFKW